MTKKALIKEYLVEIDRLKADLNVSSLSYKESGSGKWFKKFDLLNI